MIPDQHLRYCYGRCVCPRYRASCGTEYAHCSSCASRRSSVGRRSSSRRHGKARYRRVCERCRATPDLQVRAFNLVIVLVLTYTLASGLIPSSYHTAKGVCYLLEIHAYTLRKTCAALAGMYRMFSGSYTALQTLPCPISASLAPSLDFLLLECASTRRLLPTMSRSRYEISSSRRPRHIRTTSH